MDILVKISAVLQIDYQGRQILIIHSVLHNEFKS